MDAFLIGFNVLTLRQAPITQHKFNFETVSFGPHVRNPAVSARLQH
jgi:hypothetical protein